MPPISSRSFKKRSRAARRRPFGDLLGVHTASVSNSTSIEPPPGDSVPKSATDADLLPLAVGDHLGPPVGVAKCDHRVGRTQVDADEDGHWDVASFLDSGPYDSRAATLEAGQNVILRDGLPRARTRARGQEWIQHHSGPLSELLRFGLIVLRYRGSDRRLRKGSSDLPHLSMC